MRIAHAITKGDVGGAQTHVVELAVAQLQSGDEPTIIAGSDGAALERARREGVPTVIVPALVEAWETGAFRPALAPLRAALADLRPDIAHGHSSHAGLAVRIAARRLGVASVYTAHGWPFQQGAPFRQRAMSLMGETLGGRIGDAVICLTPAEAARARRVRVVPTTRLWVVPNGLPDVVERRRADASSDLLRLVMVARFAPPKMQLELLRALERVGSDDWTITFVGDGPGRDVCEASATWLGDRVRFVRHSDTVPALLAEHDVCLLWSRYEGMPMALLEGMRSGLCCLANELPGVRFLLDHDVSGLVVGSDGELVESIERLIAEPGLVDRLGAGARRRFLDAFTVEEMAEATRRVYEHVLRRRER